jgi:hypothetical protein
MSDESAPIFDAGTQTGFHDPAPPPTGLGLNTGYQSAFNSLLTATTPTAKREALAAMERAAVEHYARSQTHPNSTPGAFAAGVNSPAYADALARATNAPTPQAKQAAINEMERLTLAAQGEARPETMPDQLEGFEPARSIGQLVVPPEIAGAITDQRAFEGIREAAFAAGVPAALWQGALAQAHEHAHLLSAPDAVWNAHMDGVFAALDRSLGSPDARSAVVKDAASYLNALAELEPRLAEAADLLRCSAWGLTTAAHLWRSGVRPMKRG